MAWFPTTQAEDSSSVAREHDQEFLPNNTSYLDAEVRLEGSDLETIKPPEEVLRA